MHKLGVDAQHASGDVLAERLLLRPQLSGETGGYGAVHVALLHVVPMVR
jgi:hypothetical protein